MWPKLVVDLGEGVELALEFADGGGGGLGAEPTFHGLLEALDFAAGGRVVWSRVLLADVVFDEFVLQLAECERVGFGARSVELKLDGPGSHVVALPDELVQTALIEDTDAIVADIDAMRGSRRFSVNHHSKRNRLRNSS